MAASLMPLSSLFGRASGTTYKQKWQNYFQTTRSAFNRFLNDSDGVARGNDDGNAYKRR
jgi:hypothetical protein